MFPGIATWAFGATFVHSFNARQARLLSNVWVVGIFFAGETFFFFFGTGSVLVSSLVALDAGGWTVQIVCDGVSIFVVGPFWTIGACVSTCFCGTVRSKCAGFASGGSNLILILALGTCRARKSSI